MKEPFAKIGDKVYHITPESPVVIIVDITYSYLTKLHQYQVSFQPDVNPMWYFEHELSMNKIF